MTPSPQHTGYGRPVNPDSEQGNLYLPAMTKNDSRKVLWASLTSLMRKRWGGVNLTKLGRDAARSSSAQASRMKAGTNSTGVEMLDRMAEYFGVEAWQLLVPGFDADHLPMLVAKDKTSDLFTDELMAYISTLDAAGVRRIENLIRTMLEMELLSKDIESFTGTTGTQIPARKSSKSSSVDQTSTALSGISRPRRRA